MPRAARIILPGIPHHITQRGNNRQRIFIDEWDSTKYLNLIKKYSDLYGLRIHGYCLMPNHVHLVATPESDDSLSKAVGYSHQVYTRIFNRKYETGGHLWHGRYYSVPLDEGHFLQALIYVDRNPVRANLATAPWRYNWSSAVAHLGKPDPAGLIDPEAWDKIAVAYDWKTVVAESQNESILKALRNNTESGHPLGDDAFIGSIEQRLGINLRSRKRGRPLKQ